MKKLLLLVCVISMVLGSVAVAADLKTKSITAQNTFSDPIQIKDSAAWGASGSGWTATVSLQYCIPGNSCAAAGTDWVDTGDTLTAPGAYIIKDGTLLWYRVGVKTGNYTSGTVPVWIRAKF